jgi:hypothetical protein
MKQKNNPVETAKSLIRWRGNHKLDRVRQIASRSGQSINQMVNSWADMVIAQNEAESSFLAAAARGNPARTALAGKIEPTGSEKSDCGHEALILLC